MRDRQSECDSATDQFRIACAVDRDERDAYANSLPGGNSEREPPDPIPNSEVKTLCADGSVALAMRE